jgi:uncharacterized membrane protein/plastocyanin
MWLDRSFEVSPEAKNPGHVGEVWMVHGGGFYHVEKLLMGPTKVPKNLHWFKWESYWTWMSGFTLICLIFYTGHGTFLLDSSVSSITYYQALALSLFSIFGSWFFYDFLWERELTKKMPIIGHILTMGWFAGMSLLLCKTISGRAAYIHIGGMLGTWMTANVFMRIIPRQVKMVEASARGEPVNQEWGKNAKNRSTHNTYLTLPVIFIMLSNHFPTTYGHEYNWLILLAISAGGAAIREYFVVRLSYPFRSKVFGVIGAVIILLVMIASKEKVQPVEEYAPPIQTEALKTPTTNEVVATNEKSSKIFGTIYFSGNPPQGEKLNLPAACANQFSGDVYSNEVSVHNGKLENVLVRITKGIASDAMTEIPQIPVELDQRGCIYRPRVVAARVGQPVVFINSDPIFHNVKSVTEVNQKFNVAMPNKNQRETKIFMKPEIFLQAKCSVHPWMGAYVAVMEHPYYFVTKEDGEYHIDNLPEGNYTMEVWHETLGTQTKEFSIKGSGNIQFDFTYKK